jgi:hypothetical protein
VRALNGGSSANGLSATGQLMHLLRPLLRMVREQPYSGRTFDRLADREWAWSKVENGRSVNSCGWPRGCW